MSNSFFFKRAVQFSIISVVSVSPHNERESEIAAAKEKKRAACDVTEKPPKM